MDLLNGRNHGRIAFTWIRLAALGLILSIAIQVGRCELEPTESQCRPFIEKALKEQHIAEEEQPDEEWKILTEQTSKEEKYPTDELTETIEESTTDENEDENEELKTEEPPVEEDAGDDSEAKEDRTEEDNEDDETKDETEQDKDDGDGNEEEELKKSDEKDEDNDDEAESKEREREEEDEDSEEERKDEEHKNEATEESEDREGDEDEKKEVLVIEEDGNIERDSENGDEDEEQVEEDNDKQADNSQDAESENGDLQDDAEANPEETTDGVPETDESSEAGQSVEDENEAEEEKDIDEGTMEVTMEEMSESQVDSEDKGEGGESEIGSQNDDEDMAKREDEVQESEAEEDADAKETTESDISQETQQLAEEEEQDITPEEDLTKEVTIPENLRPRDHITQILRLDEDSVETESILEKAVDATLKSLKGLYDNAIKPLEMLYKYRDLSNRHFGDPEIFSKPLILFMGPWSGGKSTTINYLLDNEFTEMSLRTGAEPSPAYFNILMYGSEEEVLDGTQLAADWTFSGLQKFGQGLLDRLKGYKLPNRLLQKVNIVEIPGILEIRKQVQRLFPFNDACQWFIDRADIIFLVYDPSKLDVGPETEAILDQLKGREYQTRIILNKADQVKPEELMRVQGTLIWNISPLMSSTEPPVMYTTSLWSLPYESGAATRLLLAQERAFLRDLRDAIDKRVENKIASARRFAVRVRNHAKMVDCYLTTYYNHKTFFGNKKKISDDIIENPQKYHIYEGLSTLTNISRYDLPDPDVYRDFFKLNSLYDFKKLSDTCTYFRGCPINTLDVAIAYDLPELVGKYKKAVESSKSQTAQKTNS